MQYMHAGKSSDDGMRNKENHEGKGAYNNQNMHNPSLHLYLWGYMVACPALLHAAPFFSRHHMLLLAYTVCTFWHCPPYIL